MRQIGHDAHAVAGGAQSVAARPMSQALHDGQRLIHGAVRAFAAQIHDGPHAAAFVLQCFLIQRILFVLHWSVSLDARNICAA